MLMAVSILSPVRTQILIPAFARVSMQVGPLPAVCPQLQCTQVESNLSQSVPQPTKTPQ
jgi:hypothetical protein